MPERLLRLRKTGVVHQVCETNDCVRYDASLGYNTSHMDDHANLKNISPRDFAGLSRVEQIKFNGSGWREFALIHFLINHLRLTCVESFCEFLFVKVLPNRFVQNAHATL